LDHNSTRFLENIFLESVANHTSGVRTILWDTLYRRVVRTSGMIAFGIVAYLSAVTLPVLCFKPTFSSPQQRRLWCEAAVSTPESPVCLLSCVLVAVSPVSRGVADGGSHFFLGPGWAFLREKMKNGPF